MNFAIEIPAWLVPLFFMVAAVYSSAGFGGGSSYLALLVLAGLPLTQIAPLGLMCNLAVTAIGVFTFWRSGDLSLRRALPFVITSIPAALLGGRIPIGKTLFLFLLGVSLFAASLRLFMRPPVLETHTAAYPHAELTRRQWWSPFVGGVLGLLSGLTGIGGGIFLSPVLYLTRWGSARAIAATASFFIFVNSIAGLIGQILKSGRSPEWAGQYPVLLTLALAVMAGGFVGSRLATRHFNADILRRVTAALILFVSLNVLWRWGTSLGGGA